MGNPYIKMTFETRDGKDLVLTVPNADKELLSVDVVTAMTKIKSANAIDGVGQIAGPKAASLFVTGSKTYVVE